MESYESLKQQQKHLNQQLRLVHQKLDVILSEAEKLNKVAFHPVANPSVLEVRRDEHGVSWLKTTDGRVYLVVEMTNASTPESGADSIRLGTDLMPLALDRLTDRIRHSIGNQLDI